jgi:glucose/arabinose dehydrogenase
MKQWIAVWILVLAMPVSASGQSVVDPDLTIETVVTGLSTATTMAFIGPDDILVLEKRFGQVRRVLNGSLLGTPVLDVPVDGSSERGMLGIAVDSEDPPHVFLYFTEAASDGAAAIANRVYRYTWNPGLGVLESPQLVLDLPVIPGTNHDGGIVVLGPPGEQPGVGDGSLLYVVIGDIQRRGQLENLPDGAAPDDTAVVLRVQQDGSPASGNPFTPYCSVTTTQTCSDDLDCPGETCITEVASYWAYGVRNSFGLTLDPVTGDVWDTENGPGSHDEVNRLDPGDNSGWVQIMGPDLRDPQGVGDLFDMPGAGSTYSDPEFSWLDTIAPTGIVFPVTSNLGPAYDDVVLVADYNNDAVYAFPLDTLRKAFDLTGFSGVSDLVADTVGERDQFLFASGIDRPTDLKIGPDGHLYIVAFGGRAIYRVVGPGGMSVPVMPLVGHLALGASLLMAAVLAMRAQKFRRPADG